MALRHARDTVAMTQGDAADKLGWSLSKVQRVETGEVTVSVTDLQALLRLYGVQHETDRLMELARVARKRAQPWNSPALGHLDLYTRDVLQFEYDASRIRWYESGWIPDPLQTDQYFAARLSYLSTELSPEQCAAHAAAHTLRRDLFLGPPDHRPQYAVVLDESVIHRPYGGWIVLRDQLEWLLDHTHAGDVQLVIVPYASGKTLPVGATFTLIDLDQYGTTVLAQQDGLDGPAIRTDSEVHDYHKLWTKLWAATDPTLTEPTLLGQLRKINRKWGRP